MFTEPLTADELKVKLSIARSELMWLGDAVHGLAEDYILRGCSDKEILDNLAKLSQHVFNFRTVKEYYVDSL